MKKIILVLLTAFLLCLGACSNNTEIALTEKEAAAAAQLLPDEAGVLSDITSPALDNGRSEKFPAVEKIFMAENGDYVVVAAAVGYGGPVTVLTAISAADNTSYGIRILEHYETPHYVRDFDTADWFVSRFAGKEVQTILYSVHLEAKNDAEIIAVTGCTETADAVILAVNAAFGVYCEYELGETVAPVADAIDPLDYTEIVL